MTLPGWVTTAVTPTDEEVDRLRQPVSRELLDACGEATAPDSGEVDALVRRLASGPERAPTLRPALLWAGAAAVAALLLVALLPGRVTWPEPGTARSLADGERLAVGPSIQMWGPAELTFDAPGVATLESGTVTAEVDPTGPDRELTIHAADVAVSVVGTRFQVSRDGERVEVLVDRGRVSVVAPAVSEVLGASDRWSWPPVPQTAAAPPVSAPVTPVPPRAESTLPASQATSRAPAPSDAPASTPPSQSSQLPSSPHEPVAVLDPSVETQTTDPDNVADDVRHFLRIQESIDMNSAPTATLRITELFLQRHPDSELAEEATILRLELLAQTAPPRQALSALDAWLGEHPDHAQFLPLLEKRADVARNGLQDCRVALPAYRVLATRARGERKARGRAFRGLCALSEGLEEEAREALTEALDDPFLPEALRFEVTESLAHLETQGRVVPLRKAN